ncbi:MAG: DUF1304 domain-containing protein [Haliangiales bacterium]
MKLTAKLLTILIGLEHLWILVLEMFLWTTPMGHKAFNLTPEFAEASATLAANQGLYNGFLAAGLLWSAFRTRDAVPLRLFFLGCVLVAGVYGGLTAKTSILYIQALPATLGLIAVLLAARSEQA